MTPTRFPLHWPSDWKRLESCYRRDATFNRGGKDLTVFDGVQRVLSELLKLGVTEQDVIVSTNIRTRLDGLPRSGEPIPQDTGAAVYWERSGDVGMRCMAVDRYTAVADNLAAIAATLEAMRAIERHGGAAILDRAFAGFTALPAPGDDWWHVLAVERTATRADIDIAYRRLRSDNHPERGGTVEAFDRVEKAYRRAIA